MKGKFIYICKTDLDGRDRGVYIQPTRRVFPTREEAQDRADAVSPGRVAIVVELPDWVEIDKDYYPVKRHEPLSLHPGSVPCVQCGYCCKLTSCGAAPYDPKRKMCSALVDNGDGTYSCGKYDEILALPEHIWKMSPAFGAGCCSPMNGDRQRIVKTIPSFTDIGMV